MEPIQKMMDELNLENNIKMEDIPNIDLYMDQVIQLFETHFNDSKRNQEEKVMTKTMINNYAKGKLFFPIQNKKYSKEHIMLISMIYQLKGSLSINDIKSVLDQVNQKVVEEEFNIGDLYHCFLSLTRQNVQKFQGDILESEELVKQEVNMFADDKDTNYLEQVLMITSLVHMSNLYRKLAEKMVDQLSVEKQEAGKKDKNKT
ncbi:DUF1836 domain-containing protein [Bacillus carboniphilus]|uniref:DUF1836 domain-containing protein n=1 Tax=Bacillus carboniphilus TaxID=86663 RepID=A0ABN0W7U7_9BACI